jgi:hypothetical protein
VPYRSQVVCAGAVYWLAVKVADSAGLVRKANSEATIKSTIVGALDGTVVNRRRSSQSTSALDSISCFARPFAKTAMSTYVRRQKLMSKDSELFYLNKFKENLPAFPQGQIAVTESPDFLIKTARGTTGVEFTNYFRQMSSEAQHPLQARERVRRRIIDRAKAIYDSSAFSPVSVWVHFDFNFHCRTSEVEVFAERLVQLAQSSQLPQAHEKHWMRDEIKLNGVHSLDVRRSTMPKSYWSAPLVSFVPRMNVQQIQLILDKKTALCEAYRKKCDEALLVIVMDRFRASSFSQLPEGTEDHAFSHGFDFAFLFFYDYSDLQKSPILLRRV